jgi:hypothetical protein
MKKSKANDSYVKRRRALTRSLGGGRWFTLKGDRDRVPETPEHMWPENMRNGQIAVRVMAQERSTWAVPIEKSRNQEI